MGGSRDHLGMRLGARVRARGWSLALRMLLLQVCVVMLVVSIGAAVSIGSAIAAANASSRRDVVSIAETLAQSPYVIDAIRSPDPSRALQPEALDVQQHTHTDFVVFMSPAGIRYSHPNPAEIGRHFVGDIAPAQHGRTFTETYPGTLGPSVRAVTPIIDHGRVVGLVAVGVLLREVSAEATRQLPALIGLAVLALAIGTAGSLLLARRVRRQTLGLDPADIARQYQHHDAMLHAVREGLVIIDRDGRLVLANDEARRLTGLPDGGEGQPLAPQLADPELAALLCGTPGSAGPVEPIRDQACVAAERALLVSRAPAEVEGRPVGSVATLRDRTELEAALRELSAVRALADTLRTQVHESANRLQALVGLVELGRGEEAVRLGTREALAAQRLSDRLLDRVGEPALVALLLGKTAVAEERGVRLRISEETETTRLRVPVEDVLTVTGNLLDNAIDAAASTPAPGSAELTLREEDGGLLIRVRDTGPGLPDGGAEQLFARGYSTKTSVLPGGRGIGLALVRQVVARLGGTVTAAPSGPGEPGAVFTARLPARREPADTTGRRP